MDHERIWLQNAEDGKHQSEGRLWCEDKVWPDDPEDGEPTEYVRADLFATLRAENEALRAEIARLTAELAKACEDVLEEAVTAGWNACRRSIYAVCEDVEAEADRIRITSSVGTAAEEQHAKGYHAGTCRAAKSIARGFNSMEACDDDNIAAAIRALKEKQP